MTDPATAGPSGTDPAPDDTATKPPWYRRRGTALAVAVAAVLAVTVISDLPVHASHSADVAAERSVMKEVNTDVGSCAFATSESFTIYGRSQHGQLTAANRAATPALLRDDQAACSFTNNSIFELSNIEVPGSPAGKALGQLVSTSILWATSDALGAIEDIQTLFTQPTNAPALKDLAERERRLAADRRTADGELATANRDLATHLPRPDLPVEPTPRGG
ncbi:MAG TPA: hypothetical protein VKG43_06105 [Acidimicrobiales bacterium]|nr:hypothetical protein [Acidimicrobiales bacterium]